MGPKVPTIDQVIKAWLEWKASIGANNMTVQNQRIILEQWVRTRGLSGKSMLAIGPADISAFINDSDSDRKASTRETHLAIIRSFFKFCSAKDWCKGNPSALVALQYDKLLHWQKERRSRAAFTPKEIAMLLDATAPGGKYEHRFLHCAIAISRWTGLRLGDIAQLQWGSFAKRGYIAVHTDKTNSRVQLPIRDQELIDAVAAIPITKDKTWCFPEEAKAIKDYSKRSRFSRSFGRLCKRLGIIDKTFHDLRSTYITDCLNRGVPMPHIATAVGHAHTSMTAKYVVKGP